MFTSESRASGKALGTNERKTTPPCARYEMIQLGLYQTILYTKEGHIVYTHCSDAIVFQTLAIKRVSNYAFFD